MQEFAFVDETLDLNLTLSYKLSIQVSLNGFSFCIIDPVRNKFIALLHKNFEKNLLLDDLQSLVKNYIDGNELLNKEYKNIKIIWQSIKNTIIPQKYFDDKNLKKYFELSHKLDDLDEIHYKKLKYSDSYSVYAIPLYVSEPTSTKDHNVEIAVLQSLIFELDFTDIEKNIKTNHKSFYVSKSGLKSRQFSIDILNNNKECITSK